MTLAISPVCCFPLKELNKICLQHLPSKHSQNASFRQIMTNSGLELMPKIFCLKHMFVGSWTKIKRECIGIPETVKTTESSIKLQKPSYANKYFLSLPGIPPEVFPVFPRHTSSRFGGLETYGYQLRLKLVFWGPTLNPR